MTRTDITLPVLVVDDNPRDQELVAMHLGQAWKFKQGLELDFAMDGKEALEKLRTKRFALVVLDWEMPLLGKGEVLRHLRKNGSQIPVVVISGLEREDIDSNLNALKAAFLDKSRMNSDTFQIAISHALALLDFNPAHSVETQAGEAESLPYFPFSPAPLKKSPS